MTNIKFNFTINNSCVLSILDTTGYQPDNLTGFIRNNLSGNGYKLNEGYFRNVIQYNKHKYGPVTVNLDETYLAVDAGTGSESYESNFTEQDYNLAQDGVYTINRIFVISLETYNRDKDSGRFTDLSIYYSDGIDLYKVVANVATKTTIELLLKETYPVTAAITSNKIISTCYINACYYKLMSSLIDDNTFCLTDEGKLTVQQRDLLYMVLESIKYLKDQGSIQEIERLIETIDACGGICKRIMGSSNCGCSG